MAPERPARHAMDKLTAIVVRREEEGIEKRGGQA